MIVKFKLLTNAVGKDVAMTLRYRRVTIGKCKRAQNI